MRQVYNITQAANKEPGVLFHSSKPNYPLFDFIYQDGKGAFHAFQATLAREGHTATVKLIRVLEKEVGGPNILNLYYLVPQPNFDGFSTDPFKSMSGSEWRIM